MSYDHNNSEFTKDFIIDTLQEIKHKMEQTFSSNDDLIKHPLQLKTKTKIILYYFEGLIDVATLKSYVTTPLLQNVTHDNQIFNSTVITAYSKIIYTWKEVESGIFEGQCVLFMEGEKRALLINTKGVVERAIQEPVSESTIKGSHDGFIESASKNISLIRKYIPSTNLKVKKVIVEEKHSTFVYLLYLENMSNQDLVQEVKKRICKTNTNTLLNVGKLSNLINDTLLTPFPQAYFSERPDAIVTHILNGKIAILLERSPSIMIVPMNLISFFKTPDDYNIHWSLTLFIRLLRFLGFIISIFLPALYIAIISFHFEIIPLDLYTSIATSRSRVPFSPILEVIIMEITLEMLREAGIRLPQPLGSTIGIVGGIVIGQAAVQAGLVSNVMVIIVSITAIASFIIPNYELSSCIRLIRFPMMLFSYFYGIIGIVVGVMLLFAHFSSLTSYGYPYGFPIAPLRFSDSKHSLLSSFRSRIQKNNKIE